MASENRCAECGAAVAADSPGAMCPGCLLRLALKEPDKESLDGAEVGQYLIESRLGAGGMATVYLATDTVLRRQVALKFLAPAIASDPVAQRRFLREARAAAALDHPYICHIHEVAESDERAFIAMEYVRGETLGERMGASPFPVREAVRIGAEIAEAIERAHSEGIVHRDLKPGNIMLTPDGHVKVMDFGLAKRVSPGGDEEPSEPLTADLTETGSTLGTVAYMSPEQVKGQNVGVASDVFSFGTLLYQMLSGTHPFAREQALETASAILRDDPDPLASPAEDLPPVLSGLVAGMLQKDPQARPGAADVSVVLRELLGDSSGELSTVGPRPKSRWGGWIGWVAAGALALLLTLVLVRPTWAPIPPAITGRTIDSIAVMPFENLTGDPEQAFLADGITEALIRDLGGLQGMARVAPLDSVLAHRTSSLEDIRLKLNVGAVVRGSVVGGQSRVVIGVEMVNARDGQRLLVQDYPTDLSELPSVQADLARSIAGALGVALTADEQRGLGEASAVDPDAHAAYLRGRHLLRRRDADAVERAIQYFHEAIALDTSFAAGFEGLAEGYLLLGGTGYGNRPPSEMLPRAVRYANQALELDPGLAGAHTILADAHLSEADWSGADRQFQRALRLDPSSAHVHQRYSLYLAAQGRLDEAETEIRRAVALDPISAPVNATLARIFYYRRENVAARRLYQQALEMEPEYVPARLGLGLIELSEGRFEEAMGQFLGAAAGQSLLDVLGEALLGETPLDPAVVSRLRTSDVYVSPFYFALVYALAGDADNAVRWLERAHQDRSEYVIFVGVDPLFDGIRDAPEFVEFVEGLGL